MWGILIRSGGGVKCLKKKDRTFQAVSGVVQSVYADFV